MRGSKSSKVKIAHRRKQELELLAQGARVSQLPEALGVSRVTVWRDLAAIEQKFNMDLPEDFKKAMRAELSALTEGLAHEKMSPRWKYLIALQIHDRKVKLGPKIDLNGARSETTITIRYIGSEKDSDEVSGRLAAAKAEGEKLRGLNDARTVEPCRILEGEVANEAEGNQS